MRTFFQQIHAPRPKILQADTIAKAGTAAGMPPGLIHLLETRQDIAEMLALDEQIKVGVSTNKIHARGPVGLDGIGIYKGKLPGKGQIVADCTGPNT